MDSLGNQIRRMRDQGASYREISEALTCSKGTISYHLGAGQKEKTLERTRSRRSRERQVIQEIKQKSPCADCGESYPYWMMDFDHLDQKSFTISRHGGGKVKSLRDVLMEIEKCEVVCANCHRNRTHMRMLKTGSDTMDLTEHYGE